MAVMQTPVLPPIKHIRNGKYCYLVTFRNEWINGKSVPVKGDTKTVGKVAGGDVTGPVIWYDAFLEKHPELMELDTFRVEKKLPGKRKKRSFGWDFRPRDEMVSLQQSLNASTQMAGHTWLLGHLVAGTPPAEALKRAFGRYNRHLKILSLAMYMYCEGTCAVEKYQAYAGNNRLPWHRPLSPGQCSKLFSGLRSDEIDHFLKILGEETAAIEEKNAGGDITYYALDSTSLSTFSGRLTDARFGHNKDGDALRQINVLMIVSQETGVPVFYRTYAGDIPDVSTIVTTVKDFLRLGLNRMAVVVLDRGYSSVRNIHTFCQTGMQFVLNFRTACSLARNLITEHRQTLESYDSLDPVTGVHAVTAKVTWSYPVSYRTDCVRPPHEKKELFFHIYYDPEYRHDASRRLGLVVARILERLKKGQELTAPESKIRERLIITEQNEDGTVSWRTDRQGVAEELYFRGFRILVSDTVSTAREADRAYQTRNTVEQGFMCLKQDIDNRVRSSGNSSSAGRLFTMFVATSLALMLRSRIAACRMKGFELPENNDAVILEILRGIKARVWNEGLYYTEVTGKRRELLEALNVPVPSLERFTEKEQAEMQRDEEEPESREDGLMQTVDMLLNDTDLL